jgi:hypothetical protein
MKKKMFLKTFVLYNLHLQLLILIVIRRGGVKMMSFLGLCLNVT